MVFFVDRGKYITPQTGEEAASADCGELAGLGSAQGGIYGSGVEQRSGLGRLKMRLQWRGF